MDTEIFNYHTHTWRCMHASGTEREYVETAIQNGFRVLGFADHAPWPYRTGFVSDMRMPLSQFPGYKQTVLDLRARYAGQIEIPLGLECEAFPEFFPWLRDFKAEHLDYVLLGNHYDYCDERDHSRLYPDGGFYFGRCMSPREVARYCDRTVAGMATGLYDCLAHPDLFLNSYARFDDECRAVSRALCQAAKDLGMPLEYNLLGLARRAHSHIMGCEGYTSPCFWEIAAETGCTAIIGYDAHRSDVLARRDMLDSARKTLHDLGITVIDRLPGV